MTVRKSGGGRRTPVASFCQFFCFCLTKMNGGEERRELDCDGGGVGW